MKAVFDKNGYFTGDYAEVGELEDSVVVESVPNETDQLKITSYKYESNQWIFDQEYYQQQLNNEQSEELAELKGRMITQSKKNLKRFLETNRINSDCHGGVTKSYSITSEKQSYLANMILTATMAAQSGRDYQPSWNASGEPCTYDWTIEELQQLAMEMEMVVRPLISKQQKVEVFIQEAASLEELKSIDITFPEGVVEFAS